MAVDKDEQTEDNSNVFARKIRSIDGKPFEPRQTSQIPTVSEVGNKKVRFMLPLNDTDYVLGCSDSPDEDYAVVFDKRKVSFVLPLNDVSPARVRKQEQGDNARVQQHLYADVVLNKQVEQRGPKKVGNPNQNQSEDESARKANDAAKQVPKVNFRTLNSDASLDGVDVVLLIDSVRQVNNRLANTLYGYFLGDRIAYPVVEYFVRTNWKKHGLLKTMMNSNGFFFFKFEDRKGMDAVLEGGPWMIRNKPMFLNIWSPTNTLKKEESKKVAVWVKLHDVPLVAYSDDGLSMLASKIGSPVRLDLYTIDMCNEAWGRSSYARALIEISADQDLKGTITMAIPELDGNKYVMETIRVEYEWEPPRCAHCCVFGHESEECPKRIGSTSKPPTNRPKVDEDGFTEVQVKKSAKKNGFQVNNQKPKFEYRPVDRKKKAVASQQVSTSHKIQTHNPFSALDYVGGRGGSTQGRNKGGRQIHVDLDEEEVEVVYDETYESMNSGTYPSSSRTGASTSSTKFSNG
ncbi:putative transcription factor interactor and regulator CCHC(Zn) family [Helianthus annuus]|uniref:Transcription factor interactor and regulator CCHC(Zn) family n=1 Tax=Helianthus annuus TaxID=4232 RepID=A0A9K3N0I1_HELAN|nr:putative transcription factor interactor and regulator CCHC(Zn) family [Helianthus annuus]KAJ0501529.1 putative transcription factor interactor and regulator CCHC(Zn) family [Helianthus annuus]KAJ0509340.1 putative transcription factor interactor and regulator CCHC(Zn) family [Helianthus annuus]KAJ0517435.1 putative transcription factor interactor and regulator CCHC(Zn) family [Helianthus annuus]KAJ0685445.1 putative transcription factor interactor and regulator CCHC(Zn) family [Helianthus a